MLMLKESYRLEDLTGLFSGTGALDVEEIVEPKFIIEY